MAWTTPITWATNDVPTAAQFNQHIRDNSLFLYTAQTSELFMDVAQGIANYAVNASNQAHLTYLFVPREITVSSVRFSVGTASGNMDVGIYDTSYNRLWSRGSFTTPAAGSATVSISAGSPTSLTLTPAIYWLAIVADNTSAQFAGTTGGLTGMGKTKTSSMPLPSSISSPADVSRIFVAGVFS